jgi:transposase
MLYMIVIGADTRIGVRAVASTLSGAIEAVLWGRGLADPERVWAMEDCRHVAGRLERLLVARGERVVRVAPRLMAGSRRSARDRGKSDPIDALAVARAVVGEGVERLPVAELAGPELDLRLLLDHRDDLVRARGADQQRLRWHLHDLFDDLEIPAGGLDRQVWLDRIARRLSRGEQTVRVPVSRQLVTQIRSQTRQIRELEREISLLVEELCPQLVAEAGCGPLTAAKLVAELAGAKRFATDAKLARAAGVAPFPASSGHRTRHRLDRGGNRQLNLALHRLAVNRARRDPATAAYLTRKQAEGMNRMEALRCLKRHLARRVWHLLTDPTHDQARAPKHALALT